MFAIGGILSLAVVIHFALAADVGPVAKGVVILIFAATIVVPAFVPAECIPLIAPAAQPIAWIVARIVYALFLLVWLKAEEVGLA